MKKPIKILTPVLLQKVDFERHDLKGLKECQIFRYMGEGLKNPRSYSELREKRQIDFIRHLFIQLEDRLNEYFEREKT